MKPTTESLRYYTTPDVMSDPGKYTPLLQAFPDDLASIVRTIQGLMLHIFWAERYGVQVTPERQPEVGIRDIAAKLDKLFVLDGSPLNIARSPERRLLGNCRDFSLFTCAVLRSKGIPARARCGFGTYFIPDHYEDHWVVEVWDAGQERWVWVDSQIDDLMRAALHLPFDPLDMPPGQFVTGGEAWRLCRTGQADPACFGIFDMSGLAFVRGDLIRDVLSLHKIEILPWDGGWGLLSKREEDMTEQDWEYAFCDHLAAITQAPDENFVEIQELCATHPGLTPEFVSM